MIGPDRIGPGLWCAVPLLAALALLAGAAGAGGPRPLAVVAYGADRGLSGHAVTALVQDARGRLWVGTLGGGVFRYDGVEWRQLTSRDGLPSDRVAALVPGRHGEMWVSTVASAGGGGVVLLEGERVARSFPAEASTAMTGIETASGEVWLAARGGGCLRYRDGVLAPVPGLERVRVRRLAETRDGLWLLGRPASGDVATSGTLLLVAGEAVQTFGPADGLPGAPFHDLLADRAGGVWLATGAGLYRREGGRFALAAAAGASLRRPVFAIAEDEERRLWLGAEDAVLRLEGETALELKLPAELGSAPVLEVAASPSGGVFLLTPNRLLRLEGTSAEVLALEERSELVAPGEGAERLAEEALLDELLETSPGLLVDHEGGMWARAGRSVARYAGDEARRFGRDEGLASEQVLAVHVDSRGRVWAGTTAGAALWIEESGLFAPVSGTRAAVPALHEDRGGAVYAATAEAVLRIDGLVASPWAPAEGLARANGFASDAEGRLWIGTEAGAVRASAEGLETFTGEHGLAPGPVLRLARIGGEVWLAHASGLTRVGPAGFESLAAFRGTRVLDLVAAGGDAPPLAVTPRGLLSVPAARPVPPALAGTTLRAAHRSASGVLWLGTDLGLLKHVDGAEVLHSGGVFPSDPVTAIAEDSAGRVWLATRRGLYRHAPRRRPPAVSIDEIVVAGEPLPASTEVAVESPACGALVRYSGVSFVGPRDGSDLRFETRLLPSESSFGPPGRARERALPALRPGRYKLEVRAVSRDLLRSDAAALELVVGRAEEMPEPPPLELPSIARP